MIDLPLHDPTLWPVRMVRAEVAAVLRVSVRELQRRMRSGRFPSPDDGRTWEREVVVKYVKGGVREFERRAAKATTRDRLHVMGGQR